MNMSSLPPPHPSLPRLPVAGPQAQSLQPGTPYGYVYYTHYAQAYYPQMAPQSAPAAGFNTSSVASSASNRGKGTPVHLMSTWYQAGNIRCSHPGCAFYGSHKSVEMHKMDRHLIFPPDWEKRKKRPEWDADPSLKGKAIPIQGTNVILDTLEVIDAWIAERKKRFPTSARVEDKKRRVAEAIERGQLDLSPSRAARPPKRRKIDSQTDVDNRGRRQTMPSGNPNISRQGWTHRKENPAPEPNVVLPVPSFPKDGDNDSDDHDGAPEELLSKMPDFAESVGSKIVSLMPSPPQPPRPQERRLKEPQPRGPPKNPFASRPALLRNLLLPEIRMTVSNLSQAVRFLVDNDCLQNVELKPGQAAEQQKIHVLSNESSTSRMSNSSITPCNLL